MRTYRNYVFFQSSNLSFFFFEQGKKPINKSKKKKKGNNIVITNLCSSVEEKIKTARIKLRLKTP